MTSSVLRVSLEAGRGQSLARVTDSRDSSCLDTAVNALRTNAPEMSAASPMAVWQQIAIYGIGVVTPSAIALLVMGHADWLAAILTLPFAVIVLLRCAALWHLLWPSAIIKRDARALSDRDLPLYSVLIPVYKESEIAPALVEAMSALTYPAGKLEIFFITEANDPKTRAALAAARPASHKIGRAHV